MQTIVQTMQRRAPKAAPRNDGNRTAVRNKHDVLFTLDDPQAEAVFLCADFNDWSPRSLRMFRRGENGKWEKRIPLAPGRYEYKFVVDGEWIHDTKALENRPNEHGSLNSIVEVPYDYSGD